mgnify:CR=1 FL=1
MIVSTIAVAMTAISHPKKVFHCMVVVVSSFYKNFRPGSC